MNRKKIKHNIFCKVIWKNDVLEAMLNYIPRPYNDKWIMSHKHYRVLKHTIFTAPLIPIIYGQEKTI